tara:strand:- start:1126 stop:1398 length:273 start_codon:yes stop_codon:yes gene_type:complete
MTGKPLTSEGVALDATIRLMDALADIYEMKAEIERLRGALKPFADLSRSSIYEGTRGEDESYGVFLAADKDKDFSWSAIERAKQALEPQS